MLPPCDKRPAMVRTFAAKLTDGATGRYWPFLPSRYSSYTAEQGHIYPTISVVTPSYNQASFLEETICSVIGQQYPELEYIVMDGGSTDGSQRIIERYASHITFWTSAKDAGQADAIQRGFQRATGDILCWLNSDDVFIPGALWRVAEFFASRPAVECAVGGVLWIDAKGQSLCDRWGAPVAKVPGGNTYNKLLHWGQYACPQMSTFWRREAYAKAGGLDAELQFSMDRDLFIRLAKRKPFARIPYFLSCFRYHGDSKSSNIQSVRKQEDALLEARYAGEPPAPFLKYVRTRYYSADAFLRKWWLRGTFRAGVWSLPRGLRR